MTDHANSSALDHTSYSRFSGLKFLVFLAIFFASGIAVVIKFDSYFTDLWEIAQCRSHGYEQDQYMIECHEMIDIRYSFGSVYLDVQKDIVKSAQNADVIIFGNSRTARSFSTDAIDKVFKDRDLTYVILAAEGSGYKSALLTTEKLGLKPKIVLVNNEIFYIDTISEAFEELVNFPEKYETRYEFFHAGQKIQQFSCKHNIPFLTDYYCNGTVSTKWRSAVNGRVEWDLVVPVEEQDPINIDTDSRLQALATYMPAAQTMLGHRNFKQSCPVLYIVNSPVSSPTVLKTMGRELEVQTVFKDTPGLYTYDTSHMDRPNSERWAEDIAPLLGEALDNCLSGNGRPEAEEIVVAESELGGLSDFENWRIRLNATVENNFAMAPDGTQTADKIQFIESASRVMKVFEGQPIKAGETATFSVWLWSDTFSRTRIQMIRSCDREAPMESERVELSLTPTPQKYTLSKTFENDQECALVQILGLQDDITVYAWNSKLGVSPAAVDVATPQ